MIVAKMDHGAFSSVSYTPPFESTLQSSYHQHWDATMTARAILCKVLLFSNQKLRLIFTVGKLKHSLTVPVNFSAIQKYSTELIIINVISSISYFYKIHNCVSLKTLINVSNINCFFIPLL